MKPSRIAPVDRLIPWLPLAFVMMIALFGGASRADALGQVFVRLVCMAVSCFILVSRRPIHLDPFRPIVVFRALAAASVALQLAPIPARFWF